MQVIQSTELSSEQIVNLLRDKGVDVGDGATMKVRQSKDKEGVITQRLHVEWPVNTDAPKPPAKSKAK
jgi:hypothetical protein